MRGLGKDYKNVEWLAVNSLCGAVDCSMCRFYLDKQCQGCILQNQLLATKDNHVCEIYKCILNKDILSCNDCNKYPCQKFESLKNWGFLGSKCRLSFVPHNLSHKKTDLI